MRHQSPSPRAEAIPLVVASSFVAEPVAEVAEFWGRQLGFPLDVRFAPYAQVFQQLLSPDSVFGKNPKGANAILVSWDDVADRSLPTGSAEWLESLQNVAEDLVQGLEAATQRLPARWIVVCAKSLRSRKVSPEAHAATAEMEGRFAERAGGLPGTHVIRSSQIDRLYPVTDWHDPGADRVGHVPYTAEYFAALGTVLTRSVHAALSSPRKLLALDCDNTLWGGVVGEDGTHGVALGEPFRQVQASAVEHSHRGRLIALVSKNQEADARSVFEERGDEMPLQWEHVAAHRINWNSKASNLRSIAEELGLGLDSFVFVDDNPIECAAVRSDLPEVLTIRLPDDPERAAMALDHIWPLDALKVTAEDRARSEMTRTNAKRERVRRSTTTLREFLDSLDLRVDISQLEHNDVTRASQLTLRTNQFNSTTVRLQEADIRTMMARKETVALKAVVADRFGDYGTVGLAIASRDGARLKVEAFMLSCRALGRGVEHQVVRALGREALDRGIEHLAFPFSRTERNEPVARFLAGLGDVDGASWRPESGLVIPSRTAVEVVPHSQSAPPDVGHSPDKPDRGTDLERPSVPGGERWEVPLRFLSPADVVEAIQTRTRPRPEVERPLVPPRTATEKVLVRLWKGVLRLEDVGIDDQFGALGGTSLQLVRIHGRILAELGVDLEITTLFEHTTIRNLGRYLDGLGVKQNFADTQNRAVRQRAAFEAARARHRG